MVLTRSTLRTFMLVPLAFVASLTSATAAPIIFERPLPVTNVNAGIARSNVAPLQGDFSGDPYVLGDDFTIAGPAPKYNIDSISVWTVLNADYLSTNTPGDEFSAIKLYGGIGTLDLKSSTYSAQKLTYNGGANYESLYVGGQFHPIYKITFSNLNWKVNTGTLYDFAVEGLPINPAHTFALHATNFGLAGNGQPGADDYYSLFMGNPLALTYQAGPGDTAGYDPFLPFNTGGLDVNLSVTGTAVPEPAAMALLLLGGAALLRRRRAQAVRAE